MIIAYICHPYSAPTEEERNANRGSAARWALWAMEQGLSPVCSWIVLTGELEETPENRKLGLTCACAQVELCDVVIHVGPVVSSGMVIEATHGQKHGVAVLDLTGMSVSAATHVLKQWLAVKQVRSRHADTLPAPESPETARPLEFTCAWVEPSHDGTVYHCNREASPGCAMCFEHKGLLR